MERLPMTAEKEQELKRLYLERLKEAGYHTVPELVEILPPTIMNIIGSNISTAEKLFIAAMKSHMYYIQKVFEGSPPEGLNKALNDFGYMTVNEIAEANATIIAKTLHISLESAGELVLYAMELTTSSEYGSRVSSEELIDDLDKEISHYLGQLERIETDQKLKVLVEESIQKIHETIKLPAEEINLVKDQKDRIKRVVEEFTTVFPACTGFVIYNKRGEGVLNYTTDTRSKETLTKIHESIPTLFWKISLVLEERNEYGWITTHPHLVWIEAVRDRNTKRQLAYISVFIFEAESKEGVGTATPTIKGIIKEIERIIYEKI
ncbi:MAG: hypothetical protein ACTSO7_05745 [Candidatus Heimdallarchaeota archaeon]